MGNSDFDQLIHRYLTGQATPQEKQKLELWFEALDNKDTTEMELTPAEQSRLVHLSTSGDNNIDNIRKFRPASLSTIARSKWIMRMAASLLVISLVALGWFISQSGNASLFTASTDVRKMILNDGSLVWLRGSSNLSYYEMPENGHRHAELDGEGLFEVAKDPEHPFTLQYEALTIKVVGTSFNLKKTDGDIEVTVLTGKVRISSVQDSTTLLVEPGEKALYRSSSGTLEKVVTGKTEIAAIVEDTEYAMDFTNAKLSEVAERIERKFDVTVDLVDKGIGQCHITADFSDQSLSSTLDMITDVLHVQYSINGKRVELRGSPCQ